MAELPAAPAVEPARPGAADCGRCDNCRGVAIPGPADRDLVAAAAAFLRRREVVIDPRKKWIGGVRSGKIAEEVRLEPGRALSRLGDGGWGDAVLDAKHARTPFPGDVVDAFAAMITSWAPDPAPEWVTYVPPSSPERDQVRRLAEDVAARLGLPLVEAVTRRRASQPQKLMANSYQQLQNVHDVYDVRTPVPTGPVYLVDDVVDSRWTVTAIGTALREAGSGPARRARPDEGVAVAISAAGVAIVALTTRAVASLRRSIDVGTAAGRPPGALADEAGIPLADAERVLRLLDRATTVALTVETWEQSGIWTATVADDAYPPVLRERLGDAAPPVLHGAGPVTALSRPNVGVVGSRDVAPEAAAVAVACGGEAARRDHGVVSGAARGVDALGMDAARAAGGHAVGILAESLTRAVKSAEVRRVLAETLTLVTPYAPGAGFSPGFAMGRNKIIYALAAHVLVVTTDLERGGTWAGATEALAHGYADVAVWTGAGAGPGNAALADRGARGIADVAALFDAPVRPPARRDPGDDQLSFAV